MRADAPLEVVSYHADIVALTGPPQRYSMTLNDEAHVGAGSAVPARRPSTVGLPLRRRPARRPAMERTALVVHAVFEHAWHLQHAHGWIVTVSSAPYNGPLGIRVQQHTLERRNPRPGETLHFPDDLALEGATAWHPGFEHPPLLDLTRLRADIAAVATCARAARRGGIDYDSLLTVLDGDSPAWLRRALSECQGIRHALIARDNGALRRHAAGLVGLGPGLTPSGDDLLCGLMAGLHMFGRRHPSTAGHAASLLTTLAGCHWSRTTSLSRTLLHHAARGVAVEPLLDVLRTVGTPSGVRGLDILLNIGHSSGSDMLTGGLLAATVAMEWEESYGFALVPSPERIR